MLPKHRIYPHLFELKGSSFEQFWCVFLKEKIAAVKHAMEQLPSISTSPKANQI